MFYQRILTIALLFLVCVNLAAGLSFTAIDFGIAQPGEKKSGSSIIGADNRDNTYLITTEGEVGNWIDTLSPTEITVAERRIGHVSVVIKVPSDATPGIHYGKLVARGVEGIGDQSGGLGSSVQYQLEISTTLQVNVNSSLPSPEIIVTELDTPEFSVVGLGVEPSAIPRGETGKVNVRIVNLGKKPNTGVVFVDVKKDGILVKTLSNTVATIGQSEEKAVVLDLDTASLPEGTYQLYAYAKASGYVKKPQEYGPVQFTVISGGSAFASTSDIFFGSLLFLFLLLLILVLYDFIKNKRYTTLYGCLRSKEDREEFEAPVVTVYPEERIAQQAQQPRARISPVAQPRTQQKTDSAMERSKEKEAQRVVEELHERVDKLLIQEKKYREMLVLREAEINRLKRSLIELSSKIGVKQQDTAEKQDDVTLLANFVKAAMKKRYSAEDIEIALAEKGWPRSKIIAAFKQVIDDLREKHI